MPVQPRIVLITGATGRLGEAVARTFLDAGDKVVLSGRNRERLNELQAVLRPMERVDIVRSDTGHAGGVQALVDDILKRHGRIDCLVHLVGVFSASRVLEATEDTWMDQFMANALPAALLLKAVLPRMAAMKYGKAVFISSLAVPNPPLGLGPYTASKAALEAIAKAAALEHAGDGINVNVAAITTLDSEDARKWMPDVPPSHFIAPEDLALTLLYLCSDAARAVNGAVLPVLGRASIDVQL